jgi:hypothetical protein
MNLNTHFLMNRIKKGKLFEPREEKLKRPRKRGRKLAIKK